MLWLSDRSESASLLLPAGTPSPVPGSVEALDAPTAAIWRALGGGDRPRSLTLPADARSRAFWSRLFVSPHANVSRFDLLGGPLAPHVREVGPVACVSLDGDGFHGQHGRAWSAAAGNLQLSVALPVRLSAPAVGASLSMLPAVAVCDAVSAVTRGAVEPSIKWVNDIVAGGGKLSGVLTTTRLLGAEIDHVVFGIGLNVAVAPAIEPTPFVPATSCLRRCPGGEQVGLGAMLWAVLDALTARLAHPDGRDAAAIHRDYVRRSLVLGRAVRIWDDRATDGLDVVDWPPPLASGIVRAIGGDLALALEGRPEPVARGRLALEEHVRMWPCDHAR